MKIGMPSNIPSLIFLKKMYKNLFSSIRQNHIRTYILSKELHIFCQLYPQLYMAEGGVRRSIRLLSSMQVFTNSSLVTFPSEFMSIFSKIPLALSCAVSCCADCGR